MRLLPSLAAAALACAAAPASADVFYVTTGIGTAEATIDSANPLSWTITVPNPAAQWYFGGAVFAMKYDAGTTFGIQLQLFDMDSLLISSVSFATATDFANGGDGTSYRRTIFSVEYPPPLSPTDPYTVTLSVVGDPLQNTGRYSVQGVIDGLGFAITSDPTTIEVVEQPPSGVAQTPEPASAVVLAIGLLGLARLRRPVRAAVA